MSRSPRMAPDSKLRPRFAERRPTSKTVGSGRRVRWLINGYPAVLTLWTDQEWSRLDVRPSDARRLDGGLWCVLQME